MKPRRLLLTSTLPYRMDQPNVGRKKKDDKAKEKYERNGGFSQKHVRLAEAVAEKRATAPKPKPKSK